MKIHHNLIVTVAECLNDIFEGGYYADKVIERKFKMNKQLGSRDRKFIAETTYNIVRNFKLLHKILGKKPENEKEYKKIVELYIEIYVERSADKEILDKKKELEKQPEVKYSMPDWLYNRLKIELGEKTDDTLAELHKQARLIIRANTLKITPQKLKQELRKEEILAEIIENDALLIKERVNLFITEAFKKGYFEVQDFSSQLVAEVINPKPSDYVIDACAGAGGKSLHLSAKMQNKGKILCLDLEERKLNELTIRARRDGCSNIEVRPIKNNKTIKRLKDRADILLLDVPCSGLGVMKRNPDTKWKISKERIDELREIQKNILQNYEKMLKSGGTLVYSTCSILPSENEQQVEEFLKNNKNYELIEQQIILPQDRGFDGFFIAKIKKKKDITKKPVQAEFALLK